MAREPSVSVPKGFTLPWPARTIEEAMPGWGYKHPSGPRKIKPKRVKPPKKAGKPERPTDAILKAWDDGTSVTAIGLTYKISNDTVRRLARKHGREPRA